MASNDSISIADGPIFTLKRAYQLEILIVVDGPISFGPQHSDGPPFGFSEVMRALAVHPSWVKFKVTRAHRGTDPTNFAALSAADKALLTPHHQNFRFTQTGFDINKFDEVWLVGFDRRSAPSSMSDQELRIVSEYMNAGGGVFATGDHEDLGYALAGRVPRVRSMRKWYWATAPGNGPSVDGGPPQLRAPDGATSSRHDTVREGHDTGFQFEDQSDDVPQIIEPVMHSFSVLTGHATKTTSFPHPLLCGPKGIIKVLPDHPHEGECVVPSDLSRSYTFAGYTIQEYPNLPGGGPLAPEIVAYGDVIGGHTTDAKPTVNARRFAVIGAYDGHRASVGRVAVDSTWHHLFDVNLTGAEDAPTGSIKSKGFPASAAGIAAFEDIKSYFRNIAIWIARPSAQQAMMADALWNARWGGLVLEGVTQSTSVFLAGAYARDALGRIATQCQITKFRLDIPWELPLPIPLPDPWDKPRPGPGPGPDPTPFIDTKVIEDALLGGAILGLVRAFPHPVAPPPREAVIRAMGEGSREAVKALEAHAREEAHRLRAHVEGLERNVAELGRALSECK